MGNVVRLPPSAEMCFERFVLSDEISSLRLPRFFLSSAFVWSEKKEGRGGEGREKGGGVKDKRRKGKVTFRLAADWSARVKERRANATNRRGFTSYSVQDLSDAIGLFALERRTRAEITGNQWRATTFTSRSSVTSRSINTPYNTLKYCQHSERHGNFKTSVKKVRQTYT